MSDQGAGKRSSVLPTTQGMEPLFGLDPRWAWATTSLVTALALTAWALWAAKHPPVERSSSPMSLGYWFQGAQEPPAIGCDVNAVYAGPAAHEAWVVGNWGLVLHTADGGQNWDRKPLAAPPNVKFRPREPSPGSQTGWLDRMDWVQSARAGVPAETAPPYISPTNQFPPPPNSVNPMPSVVPPSKKAPWPPRSTSGAPSKPAPPKQTPVYSQTSGPPTAETAAAPPPLPPDPSASSQSAPQGPRDEDLPHLTALSIDWRGTISAIGRASNGTSWTFPLSSHVDQAALKVLVGRMHAFAGDGLSDARGCHLLGLATHEGTLHVVRPAELVDQTVHLTGDVLPDLAAVGPAVRRSLSRGPYSGVWFADDRHAFVVGDGGAMQETRDAGTTWKAIASGTKVDLYGISFSADVTEGWAVGSHGTILHSGDSGASWQHQSRAAEIDGRSADWALPHFFLVGMLGCLALVLPAMRKPKAITRQAVAQSLGSDSAATDTSGDALGFTAIVDGLSRFLRNANTEPPLTIAVSGEWGTGKSSLMRMLETDLRSRGFRPVWFDAWHHQKEDYLLAALLQSVRQNAMPGWTHRRGLIVRGRLLAMRAKRFWLPLLVLWGALFLATGFEFAHHDSGNIWDGLAATFRAFMPQGHLANADGGAIALFGTFFANAVAFWKGATPFKAKPGQLLAAVAGSGTVRDLEAKISFRQAFAGEFRDVTAALAPQKLPVFIDDLDRCRPDKVIEMLEAISFLAASGDCFVILGMARRPVELCVALEFEKLAQSASAAGTGPGGKPETSQQFASRYLEKIINIEIAIRPPNEDHSRALLEKNLHRVPHSSSVLPPKRRARPPLLVMLFVLLPIAAFFAGGWLVGPEPQASSVGAIGTAVAPLGTAAPTGSVAQPQASASVTRLVTEPVSDASRQYPKVAPSDVGDGALLSVAFLVFLLGMGVLAVIWARKLERETVVYDSLDFEQALKAWHPLVHRMFGTPRALKQFWNRVRYIAMMQPGEPSQRIPDGVLPALAAIEAFDPKLLATDTIVATTDRLTEVHEDLGSMAAQLSKSAQFGNYRKRFLDLSRDLGRPSNGESACRGEKSRSGNHAALE